MDGFDPRAGVILIAATNRPDILDPALLRPGRFDRQIPVSNPDLAGRRAVLRVHSKGKPIGPDADLDGLAKRTVGMTGADLANVINEAALLTARENGTVITGPALEEAVDRVIGGPRRKGRIISEQEKKITAYHEGGHTLAAWAMPDIDPVYKVTILARGRTGGHAVAVPEEDKGLRTRSEMIAQLVFAMGGRAAEELVFREPTTGAVSDIEQATKVARAMVTEFGMSSKLGAVKYGTEHGDPFLGRTMGNQADYSHEVARDIDDEVRKLIEAAHTEAWEILTEYRDVLDTLAGELLEKETLHRPELEAHLRRRRKAAPAHHVRRFRRPHPVGQAADQDARRAGDRARRALAPAGPRAGLQGRHRTRPAKPPRPRKRTPTEPATAPTVLTAVKGIVRGLHTAPPSPTTVPRRAGMRRGGRRSKQQPGYWYPPAQPPAAALLGRSRRRVIRASRVRRPGPAGPGPARLTRRIRPIRRPVNPPRMPTKSPDKQDDDVSRSNPPAHG